MSAMRRGGDAARRALSVLKTFSVTVGDATFSLDVDGLEGVADSGDLASDMRDVMVEIGRAAQAHELGFAGELPIGEQRYMAAVAKLGEGPQETAAVAEVLRRRAAEVSGWRDRLIRAGLLYAPSRGKVAFTVPMCADYIRRAMPETRPVEEVLDEMREDRV